MPFGFRLVKYLDLNPQNESRNRGYVKRHHTMVDDAKQIVANPNIELALIHMPFPHNPYLYDATSKEFGSGSTYFDNLILTDNFLGEIRQTMEKSNLWNESTVIVSSDHQWRINEYRDSLTQLEREITKETEHPQIPFFIKLSGSQQPLVYEKPFNTVITANLILALMRGEISTTEETKNWLDTNTDSP